MTIEQEVERVKDHRCWSLGNPDGEVMMTQNQSQNQSAQQGGQGSQGGQQKGEKRDALCNSKRAS